MPRIRLVRPNKLVGSERGAYEKFYEAARHGQEAATELAQLQSDQQWMTVAVMFERLLTQCKKHEFSRKQKNPSGLILPG